jgi:glucokinase
MSQRRGVIALDVGGSKIACGLFLESGEILFQDTVATVQQSADASISQLVSLIEEAISQSPKDVVAAGVGIVIPGWVDHKKRTVWAPNIAGWDHVPLHQRMEEQVALPLILESDRSGYVKGEAWFGAARGLSDVVFLAVGTGIGAGIMIGGQVLHGNDDLAGAVGWLALNPDFRESYRQMGCFEAEASGQAIAQRGREVMGDGVTTREVFAAVARGDPDARAIVDEVVIYLGMGVANLVNTLNPEMVVLGGGVFQSGSELFERVRRDFVRWTQPFAAQRVRVVVSTLGERAGLYGAARIALDNI